MYGYAVCNEFFVLRAIAQSRVRSEQAIDQLAFLILSAGVGESN